MGCECEGAECCLMWPFALRLGEVWAEEEDWDCGVRGKGGEPAWLGLEAEPEPSPGLSPLLDSSMLPLLPLRSFSPARIPRTRLPSA